MHKCTGYDRCHDKAPLTSIDMRFLKTLKSSMEFHYRSMSRTMAHGRESQQQVTVHRHAREEAIKGYEATSAENHASQRCNVLFQSKQGALLPQLPAVGHVNDSDQLLLQVLNHLLTL